MIDLQREIERELSLIDPPDLWDRIQADASNNGDATVLDLTAAPRRRRRPPVWLAVAAVAVLLASIGALALLDDHQAVDTTPATDVPVTEPPTNGDGPTTLAKAEDVAMGVSGRMLNIDAVQQDGEVTGEFRVNNLVVTLQCAGTETDGRDLILGGVVTDDPDGRGLVAGVGDATVTVGDLVALIIRKPGGNFSVPRVVTYANDSAGSCAELVESVPFNLDGGFFAGGGITADIETQPFSRTLARAEDVKIVDGCIGNYVIGDDGEIVDDCQVVRMTLNIDAEEEDGEVTGEFRVDNVVVTIQCTATKSTPDSAMRDLVFGGVVTDNPDALPTLDGVSVAVGDLLALIIREDPDGGRRVTLYDNTQWYGGTAISSCDALVESIPTWVDGGFFQAVKAGDAIETVGGYFNP